MWCNSLESFTACQTQSRLKNMQCHFLLETTNISSKLSSSCVVLVMGRWTVSYSLTATSTCSVLCTMAALLRDNVNMHHNALHSLTQPCLSTYCNLPLSMIKAVHQALSWVCLQAVNWLVVWATTWSWDQCCVFRLLRLWKRHNSHKVEWCTTWHASADQRCCSLVLALSCLLFNVHIMRLIHASLSPRHEYLWAVLVNVWWLAAVLTCICATCMQWSVATQALPCVLTVQTCLDHELYDAFHAIDSTSHHACHQQY